MNKALPTALTILVLLFGYGCRDKNILSDNPLLPTRWEDPYGVPPWTSIMEEHFIPAIEAGAEARQRAVDSITAGTRTPSFDGVIAALDRSGRLLDRNLSVFRVFHRLNQTAGTDAINAQAAILLAANDNAIYHNAGLFEKVRTVYDSRFETGLDAQQIRLTELTYSEFVGHGAMLSETGKAELKEIDLKLAELGAGYSGNLRQATDGFRVVVGERERMSSFPGYVVANAAREAERAGYPDLWVFTLGNASRIPFLTYAPNAPERAEVYDAYIHRADRDSTFDNNAVVEEILRLRREKARVFGYGTYAEYRLGTATDQSPGEALAFIEEVWGTAANKADSIAKEMSKLDPGSGGGILPADYWYYKERFDGGLYGTSPENLAMYFSLENVVSGISALANRLWGITFRPVPAEVYDPSWAAYEIKDTDDSRLGIIYLDLVSRDGKKDGYWCIPITNQRYDDTVRVAPVVVVGADFAATSSSTPTSLSLGQTKECFALFGEALSYILADVKYEGLSAPDATAIPVEALIMQKWALQPAMLRQYAKHYRSNDPIPENFIELINRNRACESIPALASFVSSACLDIGVHDLSGGGSTEYGTMLQEIMTEAAIPEMFTPDYRITDFEPVSSGHEAALFHRYLRAEIMACDAFEAFVESRDIFDRRIAVSLRENVFSKGNSLDAADKHLGFRGTMPDLQPFMINTGVMERPLHEDEETGAAAILPGVGTVSEEDVLPSNEADGVYTEDMRL